MSEIKPEKEYKKIWMSIKKHPIITAVICIAMLPILWPGLRNLIINWQNKPNPSEGAFLSTYIAIMGVIGVGITLYYYWKRLNNQDQLIILQQQQNITQSNQLKKQQDQINLQRKANTDQRFALAIEALGSSQESTRIGAIYSLYHLAMERADKVNNYRQTVAEILCSHIRATTQKIKYKEKYFDQKPSEEIQTTIDLLFKENGIYFKFNHSLSNPNLKNSILNNANFESSRCRKALFNNAYLMNANFDYSDCKATYFIDAHMEKIQFQNSVLRGVKFDNSYLNFANFFKSNLFFASFVNTKCVGAFFLGSMMQFTVFTHAFCQAADFTSVRAEGSNFVYTQFQNAEFWRTHLQGSNIALASFQGCNIFNSLLHGAWSDAIDTYSSKSLIYEITPEMIFEKFKQRLNKVSDIKDITTKGPIAPMVTDYLLSEKNKPLYNNEKFYKIKIDKLLESIERHNKQKTSTVVPKGFICGTLDLHEFPNINNILKKDINSYIKQCIYNDDEFLVKENSYR